MRRNPCRASELPDVDEVARERVPADRDRAGEIHVVRRVAVRDGREEHDVVGSGLGGAAADLRGDPEIGVDRHVRAVILERRDGNRDTPVPRPRPAGPRASSDVRRAAESSTRRIDPTLAGRAGLTPGLPIRPTSRILTCRPPWGRSYRKERRVRGKLLKFALPLVAFLALIAAGCGGGDNESTGGTSPSRDHGGGEGGTLVFGSAADPVALDGALVSDGESLRAIDQIFETLVTLEAGHDRSRAQASPRAGRRATTARRGRSICARASSSRTAPTSTRTPSASTSTVGTTSRAPSRTRARRYYWQTVFGGFATYDPKSGAPEDSLYKSCEAPDENTAVDHADDAVVVLPRGSRR